MCSPHLQWLTLSVHIVLFGSVERPCADPESFIRGVIKLLASSERVHNNCELPDEIYNICECLFRLDADVQARCPFDICD